MAIFAGGAVRTVAGWLDCLERRERNAFALGREYEMHRLRSLHCGYAQGYLFSAPLDADAMTALLRSRPAW